jgi:hypothetical protein
MLLHFKVYKAEFTLAKFSVISHMITPAILHRMYLPWPSCRPRWPRQVKSCVTVANSFSNICRQCKLSIKAHVHWWHLLAKMLAILKCNIAFLTCLGHLGRCDTNRIISISGRITQGDQGKFSVRRNRPIACCWRLRYGAKFRQWKHGLMPEEVENIGV